MVYLETDVEHLDDANIYLSNEDLSGKAVDLLLGTQGWRRFAYLNPMKFIKDFEKGERILCVHQGEPKPSSAFESSNLEEIIDKPQRDYDSWSDDSWSDSWDDSSSEEEEVPIKRPSGIQPVVIKPQITTVKPTVKPQVIEPDMVAPPPPPPPYPVESQNAPKSSDLLESIRSRSMVLKKVSVSEKKKSEPNPGSNVLAILSTALSSRRQVLSGEPEKKKKVEKISEKEINISLDEYTDYSESLKFETKSSSVLHPKSNQKILREYAHKIQKYRDPGSRIDFTETLFW
jgi:hypothetical protein